MSPERLEATSIPMAMRQRIIPSRRDYNRWVADQTLEDYALRFTAISARRWPISAVANTALGATSFLALEAIGAVITLRYGFANAAAAILVGAVLIFLTALPIAIGAARHGLDIDLLTRGAGFGYIGSTVTSLIYASFTFLFFGIEASILAVALQDCLGIPQWLGQLLAALVVIPVVTGGITLISRFQRWTQPLWLLLNILPFAALAWRGPALAGWVRFGGDWGAGLALVPFGAALAVVLSLVAQIGEQVDFLRFLPPAQPGQRWRWWCAVVSAGPGWIIPGAAKLFGGSLLAWLALRSGLSAADAVQPVEMYRHAFAAAFPARAALLLTGLFVAVSQLKINVTNAYAGSIAWSNFFSRLTRSHPGRVVWVVFNVAIALLLMEMGLYRAIEGVLALFSVAAAGWVGALAADLVVIKPAGLAPATFEFKRTHLYDVNPVGVGAMLLAVLLGVAAASGLLGAVAQAFAPVLSLATAFLAAPLIAYATRGRFYIARRPRRNWSQQAGQPCVVCSLVFEPDDTAFCPVYAGAICSLCCTLDARCGDACRPHGRFGAQLYAACLAAVPPSLRRHLDGPLLRFAGIGSIATVTLGLILAAIYLQAATDDPAARILLAGTMWRAFFILVIIAGVAAWLLVLAQETRATAQAETRRQTRLLLSEIAAHRRTDTQLQKAKETAEAANLAKSRFVVGLSHELRTPLNAVLGYAQLLELDDAIPPHRREAIRTIRRSGEHLAGLIDGLLDVSKIEAGRIQIQRQEVRLPEFIEQLVDVFRPLARAKGIGFSYERDIQLPAVVHTDETRLRQILINLLSNAVKFTTHGGVTLRLHRKGAVMQFEVADTGRGIRQEDMALIFEPFARVQQAEAPVPGVGLGLTITKLLTEILGGEISTTSQPGRGSTFRVRLLLSEVARPSVIARPRRRPQGYAGRRRTLLVADDDATHRALLDEVLAPLGFTVLTVPDAESCLRISAECQPDGFILDLSMPGLDGWALARRLREAGHPTTPILIVSAHPDDPAALFQERRLHDCFLAKPIDVQDLVETLGAKLRLDWIHDAPPGPPASQPLPATLRPHVADLRHLVEIGHLSALRHRLDTLAKLDPAAAAYLQRLRDAANSFRLDELATLLQLPHQDAA